MMNTPRLLVVALLALLLGMDQWSLLHAKPLKNPCAGRDESGVKPGDFYAGDDDRRCPDFSKPSLKTAIVREDNDIDLSDNPTGKRVILPKVVAAKIHVLAQRAFAWRVDYIREKEKPPRDFPKLKEFYGPIYRVNTPDHRHIYVFKQTDSYGFRCYYLILYDQEQRKVTQEPPCVQGKWTDMMQHAGLMTRPYLFFEDINQDGQPEVVIEEHGHNGNVYNAIIYHYFHLEKDLNLKHILALETRLLLYFTDMGPSMLVRTVEKLAPNKIRIRIEETFKESPSQNRPVGEVLLESENAASVFKIKSREVQQEGFERLLITGAEEDDEGQFLGKGLGLYY
jgi:hypothetical protein